MTRNESHRARITSSIALANGLPGEGEWVDQPHRAIAFGFFYYAIVAWSELYGHASFSWPSASNRS